MKTNFLSFKNGISLFLVISLLSLQSCKKDIFNKNGGSTNPITSDMVIHDQSDKINNCIDKSVQLFTRFETEESVENTTYSVDSALFYLQALLNIKHGDLNVYEVESKRVNFYRFIQENGYSESALKNEYSEIKSLVNQELNNVEYPDKAVEYIMISRPTDELNANSNYYEIKIVIGRKNVSRTVVIKNIL